MSTWYELTEEKLNKLSTHRLLNVLRLARYQYNDSAHLNDIGYVSSAELSEREIFFRLVKKIADGREHIPRKDVDDAINDNKPASEYKPFRSWFSNEVAPRIPQGSITDAGACIGKQVYKSSKKPFKSKQLYNTVATVTVNPHTGLEAFTFEEDTSIVDVHQCSLRKEKKSA